MRRTETPIDRESRSEAMRVFIRGDEPKLDRTGCILHRQSNRTELVFSLEKDYNCVRQLRAQSVALNAAGSYLRPSNFEASLEIAGMQFNAFRPDATVERLDRGGASHHPGVNDTNQIGTIVPENSQIGSLDVVQFQDFVFQPWKYSSGLLVVSNELEEDSGISLDVWLGALIGQRIGRIQAFDWTSRVLIPQASQGASAASHTVIAYGDVENLEHSVDPWYRESPACGFMCNNAIRKALKLIRDANGRPIFAPRRRPDELDTLDGFKIRYNPYLPATIAAGNQCLFFGAWDRIHIRDVRETRLIRMSERFAEYDQTAIAGLLRSDCILMDAGTHPIQYLLQ